MPDRSSIAGATTSSASFREVVRSEMPQERKIVSVRGAAEFLRIHPSTVYRMLKRHNLPGAFRVGHAWRVDLDELNRFFKTNPSRVK